MRLRGLLKSPWALYLPLALCILAMGLGWRMTVSAIRRDAQHEFDFRVEATKTAISRRMQAYEQVLRGARGLMNASGLVDRRAWRTYVEGLYVQERYPGIQGIGFAVLIAPRDLERHTAAIRAEGFPNYVVHPPGPRPEYSSVIYLEPFDERNQRAFGFDMLTEERRRQAMDLARDSGRATISGKVRLVQEAGKDIQAGVLMYLPVYRAGAPVDTSQERRAALVGYVYSPFRMRNLMHGILGGYLQDIDLEIFDGTAVEEAALMYDSDMRMGGLQNRGAAFRAVAAVYFYGRPWTLYMESLPDFEARLDSRAPDAVLAFGAAISVLLFLVIRSLQRTNVTAQSLAGEMTAGYQRELDERRKAEGALAHREEETRLLLQSMWEGVYGLDTEGRCTFCNPAGLRMLGYEGPEALLGRDMHALVHHRRPDGTPMPIEECRIVSAFAAGERVHAADEVFWRMDGTGFPVEYWASPQQRDGVTLGGVVTFIDITEKKRAEALLRQAYEELEQRVVQRTTELAAANSEMNTVLGAISAILVGLDHARHVRRWNAAAAKAFGLEAGEALGRPLESLALPWETGAVAHGLEQCRGSLGPVRINRMRYGPQAEGRERFLMLSVCPLIGAGGEFEGFLLLGDDITDIQFLEAQLAQAQRLESIGQLAAGIAHEINTPAQYVGNNIKFVRGAVEDMLDVLAKARALLPALRAQEASRGAAQELADIMAEREVEYLAQELPGALDQTMEGVERISVIVRSVRQFAHPGQGERKSVDINAALESTLVVSRNEWKYVAEVDTDFDPDLPEVMGLPGELNQVFLNIVVNASHAIADVVAGTEDKGRILVRTRAEDGMVRIAISDTGPGIPPEARARVFDPFFTTKPVGKGTGQGLSIAYDIVVNKHGGALSFETESGRGTTFVVRLPLDGGAELAEAPGQPAGTG